MKLVEESNAAMLNDLIGKRRMMRGCYADVIAEFAASDMRAARVEIDIEAPANLDPFARKQFIRQKVEDEAIKLNGQVKRMKKKGMIPDNIFSKQRGVLMYLIRRDDDE